MAFALYLLFTVSWFVHFGERFPALGAVRFDLVLACVLAIAALARPSGTWARTRVETVLWLLIAYAALTLPFVEWPGSVIRTGIPTFAKAAVFYFFTVAFVGTPRRLAVFLTVFVGCQLFRVLEPLYLHLAHGYWGSAATTGNWGFLERLSGAPHDTINPNGLAFVVCTVLPFLWYFGGASGMLRLVAAAAIPACLYALVLTGSRSGFVALLVLLAVLVWQSRHRVAFAAAAVALLVVGFPLMSPDLQDRYLSIVGKSRYNEATAEGRMEGVSDSFAVAMRRPLLGHGLGTSREANANYGMSDQPAHNLYAEVAQEVGFVGLAIVLALLVAVVRTLLALRRQFADAPRGTLAIRCANALQAWLAVNLIFSLASYGLSSYEWYLLAGLAVVTQRLAAARERPAAEAAVVPGLRADAAWKPPAAPTWTPRP